MFTSLKNQIPSTLSITTLVFVNQSRAFPLQNAFSLKSILKGKRSTLLPFFLKTPNKFFSAMLKPINLLTYYIFYKWFLHNRKNDIRHRSFHLQKPHLNFSKIKNHIFSNFERKNHILKIL